MTKQAKTVERANRDGQDDRVSSFERLRSAIELSRRPGVGAARFKHLVDRHGTVEAALAREPEQLEIPTGSHKVGFSREQLRRLEDVSDDVHVTIYGDPDYPWLLRSLAEPPPYLFRKGSLWPIPPVAVAVVGPRRCTAQGERFARRISRRLAARGVVIVSGGAVGIDAAAHRGALEAGGVTVLVTATGVDRIYPRENSEIFRGAVERGCLLTELLPGTPPRRDFFPTRNRIIVGLSEAVIVVEGKLRTGTWSSASHALRQRRPLLVWRGSPSAELRDLPELLCSKGARSLDQPDAEVVMGIIKRLTVHNRAEIRRTDVPGRGARSGG